ncbi:MAG: hypothetical protein M3280_06530, partial [Actinomycetota bacterium]|nr:hypothetical protein [Actinomycetota bacterium]
MEQCADAVGSQLAHRGSLGAPPPRHGRRLGSVSAAPTPTILAVVMRSVRLVAGLALFALGLALMLRAQLGLSAWDVLHDAIRSLTPLT